MPAPRCRALIILALFPLLISSRENLEWHRSFTGSINSNMLFFENEIFGEVLMKLPLLILTLIVSHQLFAMEKNENAKIIPELVEDFIKSLEGEAEINNNFALFLLNRQKYSMKLTKCGHYTYERPFAKKWPCEKCAKEVKKKTLLD